jgi:O-antigen/teichoic acid export membrane protein
MRLRLREAFCPAVLAVGPVASTAAGNAVIAVCGLLSGTLLARMLGADGRGELAAIQAWPLVLATAGNFGLTEAAAYYAATTPGRARTTLSSALLLALPFSAVAVVAGVWILPRVLGTQTPEVQDAARISLLLVPLLTLTAAPHQALRGAGHYKAWNILRLITPAGWVAALMVLAAFGQAGAVNAAAAFILVTAISACVGHLYAWRTLKGPIAPTRDQVRPLLSYGAPTAVAALPQWLNLRLDQLVMIALLAPESLGLYAVAVAWGGAAQPLATVLAYVAVPALASTDDARRKAHLVYRSGAIVSACAAALLLAITPVALPMLFGAEFSAAVPAALILAAAGAITGMNAVGGECLRGLGRPRGVLLAEIAGLVVTCIAVPVLIPIAGIVGAATASLASYLAILLVQRRLISTAGDADGAAADRNLVLAIEAPPR